MALAVSEPAPVPVGPADTAAIAALREQRNKVSAQIPTMKKEGSFSPTPTTMGVRLMIALADFFGLEVVASDVVGKACAEGLPCAQLTIPTSADTRASPLEVAARSVELADISD